MSNQYFGESVMIDKEALRLWDMAFKLVNGSTSDSSTVTTDILSGSVQLHAPPLTDFWRKPGRPSVNATNAPTLVTKVDQKTFKSARVTVSADWSRLYDQAGLILLWPQGNGASHSHSHSNPIVLIG